MKMLFLKLPKILCVHFILLLTLACGGEENPKRLFALEISPDAKSMVQGDKVGVKLINKKDTPVDQLTFEIDGKQLSYSGDSLLIDIPGLGNKILKAEITYEGKNAILEKKVRVLADSEPVLYTYEVVNIYPHDDTAYTQGLEFYGDTLYESTGKRGRSAVRKLDYRTGKVLKEIRLANKYFGEGITILGNKVYLLTWQSGQGFVYDRETLNEVDQFSYGKSREGWGLCNDGQVIYKSDGTEKIWRLDPETLQEMDYIQTVTNRSVFNKANELEYVSGKIYANVWQKESLMIIDSQSGAIEGVVNMGGLKEQVRKHPELDVLNGIAYHPERKTFFVTGKNWDKLFEILIKPRP